MQTRGKCLMLLFALSSFIERTYKLKNRSQVQMEPFQFISPANMNWVIFAALGFATIFVWGIFGRRHRDGNRHRQPPGPRALPIIGHFHLLIDKTKPIHQILSSLSAKHGPIMNLRFGSRPVLVISSSELAKQCLSTNDLAFASRPQLAQGQHLGYDYYFL
ncbi:hypothetical protein KI387_002591, partial [Taxus chinensis]